MNIEELELPFWFPRPDRPGVSAAEIEHAEKILNRRLPTDFTKALRVQNGGVSQYAAFARGDYRAPLPAFLSVDGILEAEASRDEYRTPTGVVVIASGGHDWLGLDYSAGEHPTVIYQEYEDAEIEFVAPSFQAFLAGLIEE